MCGEKKVSQVCDWRGSPEMGTQESKMFWMMLGHVECRDGVGRMLRESVQGAGGRRSQVRIKEA